MAKKKAALRQNRAHIFIIYYAYLQKHYAYKKNCDIIILYFF